jgi:hypothetical protein
VTYAVLSAQIRDGNEAGIEALRAVQHEIAAAKITNPKLADNAAKRMAEWEALRNESRKIADSMPAPRRASTLFAR